MNRPHQSLFREPVFGVVNLQERGAFDQGVADRANKYDDSPGLLRLANKRLDIEFGDRARLARIPQGLGGRAELSSRGRSLSRPPHGGGLVTKASEHVANDLATLVSGQMKHVRDLQVAQPLHQAGKQKHADDKHNRHQDRGEQRHRAGCAPIDPGERKQCVNEGRGEGPERMKKHTIASEPKHQPRRVGDRAELHHDEGHGENDFGQRHHARCRCGEICLCRGNRQIQCVGRKKCLLDSRQRQPAHDACADVDHRYEPKTHWRLPSLRCDHAHRHAWVKFADCASRPSSRKYQESQPTFHAPGTLRGSGASNEAEKYLPFIAVRGSSKELL